MGSSSGGGFAGDDDNDDDSKPRRAIVPIDYTGKLNTLLMRLSVEVCVCVFVLCLTPSVWCFCGVLLQTRRGRETGASLYF